jgi:methionyl-tRNA formyltransferase
MKIVVLGCGDLAVQVSNRLLSVRGVTEISLIRTPYVTKKRSFRQKVIYICKTHGLLGLVLSTKRKVRGFLTKEALEITLGTKLDSRVREFRFWNFHDPLSIAQMRSLQPELGVVVGTYILKESVFSIPKWGCVNLHTGKVPEYRGASPGFWEMYNAESSVGITIHRVVAGIDAGNVLLQEVFPFDNAPEEDPLSYIERYRREVLLPNGIRMLAEVVGRIADGTAEERRQDPRFAKTYKSPTHKDVRELRHKVAERLKRANAR